MPGSVRPSYHTLPFSSLSAPACAAAMSLGGDGRTWCSVGKEAFGLDEKSREGVTVLQNVHSYFLWISNQHNACKLSGSERTCRRSVIEQRRYCRQQPVALAECHLGQDIETHWQVLCPQTPTLQ